MKLSGLAVNLLFELDDFIILCSHLDDDDSRCVTHQVTSPGLQLLSDQVPSADSLQINDEGFTAPPEDAAAV